MTDPAQTALFLIIVVLAILLVVLGVQVFFILRELKRTITKANKVLDDTGVITESVSKPVSSLSTLFSGIKAGATIASIIKGKKESSKKDK
jgi:hypothetical protein